MPKKREIKPDTQLNKAVESALEHGITLTQICTRAGINQVTLWRWRKGKASPVMNERTAVLDAIDRLLLEVGDAG